jgi:hypothetical protein
VATNVRNDEIMRKRSAGPAKALDSLSRKERVWAAMATAGTLGNGSWAARLLMSD